MHSRHARAVFFYAECRLSGCMRGLPLVQDTYLVSRSSNLFHRKTESIHHHHHHREGVILPRSLKSQFQAVVVYRISLTIMLSTSDVRRAGIRNVVQTYCRSTGTRAGMRATFPRLRCSHLIVDHNISCYSAIHNNLLSYTVNCKLLYYDIIYYTIVYGLLQPLGRRRRPPHGAWARDGVLLERLGKPFASNPSDVQPKRREQLNGKTVKRQNGKRQTTKRQNDKTRNVKRSKRTQRPC